MVEVGEDIVEVGAHRHILRAEEVLDEGPELAFADALGRTRKTEGGIDPLGRVLQLVGHVVEHIVEPLLARGQLGADEGIYGMLLEWDAVGANVTQWEALEHVVHVAADVRTARARAVGCHVTSS